MTAAAALACFAETPAPDDQHTPPASSSSPNDWDVGAQYDPRADYEQGVLSAEEEIESNSVSFWVLTTTNQPLVKDAVTDLPVRAIPVGVNEPWHRQCMEHRIRGHNDTVLKHLGLTPATPAPASATTNGAPRE